MKSDSNDKGVRGRDAAHSGAPHPEQQGARKAAGFVFRPSACGALARELEARAIPSASLSVAADAGSFDARLLRVAFRQSALEPEAWKQLQARAELSFVRLDEENQESSAPAAPRPEALVCLLGPRGVVAEYARVWGTVRCLLDIHDAASAPMLAPRLVGVLNLTPDSFSDGGELSSPSAALERAAEWVAAGAHMLDLGGESSRPGSLPVSLDEECERVLPSLERIRKEFPQLPISIDTTKAELAARAVQAGADWINDISAGAADPQMLPTIARNGAGLIAMHMRGTPPSMQAAPHFDEPVREVLAELRQRVALCLQAGIPFEKLVVDPGIGFGKRLVDNISLLRRLPELRSMGLPLYLGVSRKSFLGHLTGESNPRNRMPASATATTACILGGADYVRVHDVAAMGQVVAVAGALTGNFARDLWERKTPLEQGPSPLEPDAAKRDPDDPQACEIKP